MCKKHPVRTIDDEREDLLRRLGQRAEHRAAGRVLVPAAAELLGDSVDVDVALRAHADAPVVRPVLLEEHDRDDLLHRQGQVDQPFGVLVAAAALLGETPIDPYRRNPSGRVELHPAQHRAEQLQSTQVVAVEDAPRHGGRADARLHALPADVEGSRRDAGVVERAGVRQDRDVDVDCDLGRQRDAEALDEVARRSPHGAHEPR